jgi:hypothetical protein
MTLTDKRGESAYLRFKLVEPVLNLEKPQVKQEKESQIDAFEQSEKLQASLKDKINQVMQEIKDSQERISALERVTVTIHPQVTFTRLDGRSF